MMRYTISMVMWRFMRALPMAYLDQELELSAQEIDGFHSAMKWFKIVLLFVSIPLIPMTPKLTGFGCSLLISMKYLKLPKLRRESEIVLRTSSNNSSLHRFEFEFDSIWTSRLWSRM